MSYYIEKMSMQFFYDMIDFKSKILLTIVWNIGDYSVLGVAS